MYVGGNTCMHANTLKSPHTTDKYNHCSFRLDCNTGKLDSFYPIPNIRAAKFDMSVMGFALLEETKKNGIERKTGLIMVLFMLQ